MDLKETILKILQAIDYADDQEAFAVELTQNIQLQAVMNLIESLPPEKQPEVKKEFATLASAEKATEIIQRYFTEEQIKKELDDTSKNIVSEWLAEIKQSLNDSQKEKLSAIISDNLTLPST